MFKPPKPFKLYDTYQKTLVVLDPQHTVKANTLKMYSCGPTVYNYQSIGNMRAAWLPDTIARIAKLAGWQVEWTLNITDVGHLVSDGDEGEDKIEKGAKREGKTVDEIVQFYTADYRKQTQALNLKIPRGKHNPKATEYIREQMLLALQLLANQRAYVTDDGIYFDTLANRNLDLPDHPVFKFSLTTQNQNQYTGREIVQTWKKHPDDFALWKFVSPNNLQKWQFSSFPETENLIHQILQQQPSLMQFDLLKRWGAPGWHSECVCMICGTLNGHFPPKTTPDQDVIDLHTGGEDHIEIHHKNEILQSQALGFSLAKHWVHNKFVMVDGQKMSKSLGNVYLVRGRFSSTGFYSLTNPPTEIKRKLKAKYGFQGFEPLAYRLMLMEHHYTEQLNFTWDKLEQSQLRLWHLRKEAAKLTNLVNHSDQKTIATQPIFLELLELLLDNLNLPKFLEKYQALLSQAGANRSASLATILAIFDHKILSLDLFPKLPTKLVTLANQREMARKQKNFTQADALRAQINCLGWQIDDYPWGYGLWKKCG